MFWDWADCEHATDAHPLIRSQPASPEARDGVGFVLHPLVSSLDLSLSLWLRLDA